ncbi:conserved hypothetical protein [Sporisorium reilianum SRZ2]|uniref:AB hydrolase-1 domain-containing protein n=1 Tax=Sporisorium reilianum (strain SRZ2) TaxID=999809 RepID=E6ZWN3_SPORE|nr:conserved hypothetical protein [Sporisorium reilianum SRZ2]
MTDQQEIELRIPSIQPGVDIVGLLHRVDPSSNASSSASNSGQRRIALILHGLLAHKNQCYHRALASALPIDSFRFDFRGNGDTGGDWTMENLGNDVEDLSSVIRHLHHEHGYAVELIVAHSRGSMVSWMYLSRPEADLQRDMGEKTYVEKLVVVSGRWHMHKVLESYARFQEGFDKQGFYEWNITSAGKKRQYIVWPNDLQAMSQLTTPVDYVAKLNTNTHVLILHGTADRLVDQQDAQCYFEALSSNRARHPDTHRLHFVEGADHMYRGCTQPVVDHVLAWFSASGNKTEQSDAATPSTSTSRL